MAQLLDLPEEVLESSILPHLSWNDLLRCRRVCKTIKGITDGYIRLNPQRAPEIEVTENGEKNLKAFVAMGIPTTKLFLNNPTGHHFYDNLDTYTLTKFTTTNGPMITSLHVVEFSGYPCFNELIFFKGLTKLKTFEADHYGFGGVPSSDLDQMQDIEVSKLLRAMSDPHCVANFYPPHFKTIEVLKIGHNKQFWIGRYDNRFMMILPGNLKLVHLSFPFGSDIEKAIEAGLIHPSNRESQRETFFNLLKVVGGMLYAQDRGEGQKSLKSFDFISYHEERGMEIEVFDELTIEQCVDLVAFIKVCSDFGVKLLNINPAWYHQLNGMFPSFNVPIHGHPVVSLVNLHACVFTLDMPNLEKINICQTSRSNVSPDCTVRPDWPALKILEINVNSKKAVETETPEQDTALLFKFLWTGIVRGQLTEITLKFQDGKGKDGVTVAIPKTEDIVSACPNLCRLRIENWPGTNKQLTKLWSGLPGLEELALEYCKDLGNVAFVGEDVNNPVFFRLRNLKKLTLKGLDQMPKITDTLFSLVLSKMQLSHLIIGSDKPLEKVTKVGIIALLEGKFGESIEKFLFHGWSVANISVEEFKDIEKRFRSFDMM